MKQYILDRLGNPVEEPDIKKWGEWFQNTEARVVGFNRLPGDIKVSTVFLGLDHSWDGGPPVLWETMIFGGEHDSYQDRYTTRDDAIAGHAKALDLAEKGRA